MPNLTIPAICRALALAGLIVTVEFAAPAPAQAQGVFERLFGGFNRMTPPPSVRGYAPERDPLQDDDEVRPRRLGGGMTFCVRTCDGRYFPVTTAGGDPQEACKSFCPAAQTEIFRGGAIDHAYSAKGKRYSELPNAFVFRDKIVDNCSCNGKSPLGLARADAADDPTLRTGDIVATNDGLRVARLGRKGEMHFTEIDKAKIYGEMRRRLSQVKVTPHAPATTDGLAAED